MKKTALSDTEIGALLAVEPALPPEEGLRRWTHHTLFGLIAVTGMRISEAMSVLPAVHARCGQARR